MERVLGEPGVRVRMDLAVEVEAAQTIQARAIGQGFGVRRWRKVDL